MRRTYIIIVAALIILGTVSSLALTYVQTEFDEPWGAQYTLQYTGASVELSNQISFRTQGDNNPSVDPWTVKSSEVVGRQEASFAGIGNYFLWMRIPAGIATIGVLMVMYLFWPNIIENIGGRKNEF